MSERYQPTSPFLQAVLAEEAPLSGDVLGEANLHRLITLTHDGDRTNRDWATFLLAQEDIDTPAVRSALVQAASDTDEFVRAEAILGLAMRDPAQALPLVQAALKAASVALPVLEAAALCADPSLIDNLRDWAAPSDQPELDNLAAEALAACERLAPRRA